MLVVIVGMVLVMVGVFMAAASKAGTGWALVASLATGVAFGIPLSIAWARQRRRPSQDPVPFVPLASQNFTGAVLTLRPTASARWVTLIFCLAIAGGLVGVGVRDWITSGQADPLWALGVVAVIFVAIAYSYWSMYIQADATAIVVRLVVARSYDRREVAAIRIGSFEISYYQGSGRRVRLVRSDGSVLFTTIFYWWGKDQLEALASYLGVPIQLAD